MNVALRPEYLNILSICTGGAGLDLGIELAVPGARTVCMVEREGFAIAQLVSAMEAGLLAPAPIWSDARTFNGRQWRGAVDGLIGGIPCQPHSLAGKRLGEEDERDLWSTARRILVQSGAWFALIENVRGMLTSGGAERVWRDLRRLGFTVEGGLFTASEVGATHERERFFLLAVADSASRGHQSGPWRHGVCGEEIPAVRLSELGELSKDVPGVSLADAICERRCGGHGRWQDAEDVDASGKGSVRSLVDASGIGRGEGQPKSELRGGRDTIASAGDSAWRNVDDATRDRNQRGVGNQAGTQHSSSSYKHIVEPNEGRWRPHDVNAGGGVGLFPPGPSDLSSWRDTLERAPELEPAFRRVADGLATRLDIARVDRLRMLGNGVVPLEAAYAFRTLSTRLAKRGSSGAARLVRMMGESA